MSAKRLPPGWPQHVKHQHEQQQHEHQRMQANGTRAGPSGPCRDGDVGMRLAGCRRTWLSRTDCARYRKRNHSSKPGWILVRIAERVLTMLRLPRTSGADACRPCRLPLAVDSMGPEVLDVP